MIDIELLREIFKDERLHVGLALVDKVTVADDLTSVAVECSLLPENRKIVVVETWESVGEGTCNGDIPDVKDLLVVVMADGDPDRAYSIRRLSTHEEKLPEQIKDGHYVLKAKPGKKLYLASDTKVVIGKGLSPDSLEPLVLGLAMVQALNDVITQIKALSDAVKSGPVGIGNLGAPVPTFPALIASLSGVSSALVALKSQYLISPATNILSQKNFTERGV